MSKVKYVDYLKEDEPIPGQNWVCLSFLAPEMAKIKNCSLRSIKIRGIYNRREDADKRAEQLRDLDPDFDVFVGEVGKWLPWDPTEEQVDEEKWREQEKELQRIAHNYKKAREQSKVMHEERKKELMKKSALEQEEKLSKIKDRLRKKIAEKKNKNKTNDSNNSDNLNSVNKLEKDKIKEMMDKIENKEKQLLEESKDILQDNIRISNEILKDEKDLENLNAELENLENISNC